MRAEQLAAARPKARCYGAWWCLPVHINLVQDLPDVRRRLCQFFGLVFLRAILHFALRGLTPFLASNRMCSLSRPFAVRAAL